MGLHFVPFPDLSSSGDQVLGKRGHCDPMDCSLPSSSVHGIFQVIVLEWIAIFFSRGSSQPRDGTWVSCIVDRCFTICATRVVF